MDALHADELDVGGRRRAGDERDRAPLARPRRNGGDRVGDRRRRTWSVANDAEVLVRHERARAAPMPGAVEDDRPGLSDREPHSRSGRRRSRRGRGRQAAGRGDGLDAGDAHGAARAAPRAAWLRARGSAAQRVREAAAATRWTSRRIRRRPRRRARPGRSRPAVRRAVRARDGSGRGAGPRASRMPRMTMSRAAVIRGSRPRPVDRGAPEPPPSRRRPGPGSPPLAEALARDSGRSRIASTRPGRANTRQPASGPRPSPRSLCAASNRRREPNTRATHLIAAALAAALPCTSRTTRPRRWTRTRDVDLHRADVVAGAAERRGLGRAGVLEPASCGVRIAPIGPG